MEATYAKAEQNLPQFEPRTRWDNLFVFAIAALIAVLHLLTNGRYGFHRDELQFLSDARHLDWGFVAYPPLTPFLERISFEIFGPSLVGLRLFSVISQSLAIVFTGLIARELGGGRIAQVAAALAVTLSPVPLFNGTEFQYGTFDYLWWILIAYFVIRLLKTENPRWWLGVGAAAGVGIMTKYTICFVLGSLLLGFLFTRARRFLASWWFAAAVALAFLILLPNLIWQVRHDFISYHFLHYIHARDIRWGRSAGFISKQFIANANVGAIPLWIAGLWFFMRSSRYRSLAWMYLLTFAFFFFSKARFYYLAPAYPMLIAMGACAGERWVTGFSRVWLRRTAPAVFFLGVIGSGVYPCMLIVPLASSGPIRQFALNNNGDLREQFGWHELVQTVAAIRDSLPPEQRQNSGVIVGNYGESGAIELFGPAYNLPAPISLTNSAWLRGYPTPPPSTLIVVGHSRKFVDEAFTSCRLAGHNGNAYGIKNEESQDHPDIFVCGSPRKPWPDFWDEYQSFG